MAKKKKRKLKKLLAAALLGGLGLAAARSKRNKAIDEGIDVAEADKGSDMLPETSGYITKKVEPSVLRTPPIGKMHGAGSAAEAIAAQDKRANVSNYIAPVVDTPDYSHVGSAHPMKMRFSKGGSVKRGVGIAKRGFGRALKGK